MARIYFALAASLAVVSFGSAPSDEIQLPPPDLPLADPPSKAVIGPTMAESHHEWPGVRRSIRSDAPNVILIMNDDVGFGASATFGGPIDTPTMTRLANKGISYNRFHVTGMCAPTRAALLTGRMHHNVGSGVIPELATGFPGYIGRIPKSAASVAKVLQAYGYATAGFGKWHNTPPVDFHRTGPFDQWPTGIGFGYFYGFLAGMTSQYEPRLFENQRPIEPPTQNYPPHRYHLTDDLADQAVKFLKTNRALSPGRPFFMYFAPGGTHGPHHVFKEYVDKYKDKFNNGWEAIRPEIYQRQKDMGWIPADTELTDIHPTMVKWADVPENERPFQIRLMEVYAGFLEHTDTQIGRVIDELESQGIMDNTLIFYCLGDNGASAEGRRGSVEELLSQNVVPNTIDQHIQALEEYGGLEALGSRHFNNIYHASWAWALDTPLLSTKLVAAHFGGTRTPLVISWPKMIAHDKTPRSQFHHVDDLVPTIYEAVGIQPPGSVEGVLQQKLDGVSMLYTFDDATVPERKPIQYFDIMGSRAVYQNGWMASTIGPRIPWAPDNAYMKIWDARADDWELYDLTKDFSQAKNLASEEPEKLAKMKELFLVVATENNVLPVGAGLYIQLNPSEGQASSLTSWNLFPGQVRISEANAPLYRTGFSSLATIQTDVPENANGVLYCVGGGAGGFSVYFDDNYLRAEYMATVLYRSKAKSANPVAAGPHKIEVRIVYDAKKVGDLTLSVDGEEVANTRVEVSMARLLDASETFDVGMDLGAAASRDYDDRLPFEYNGKITLLNIKYI